MKKTYSFVVKPNYNISTGHQEYSGYGAHVKDSSKQQRRENKREARNARRGIYDAD